mgnify:CR=1 FL=1|tara:strand:- start:174 stop:434 length:261 start_codon:yes stop_codon:yes gene_type:complete
MDHNEKNKLKSEMNLIVNDLEKNGVKHNSTEEEMTGLGDVVEATLQKFGVTEERFKEFFGLRECNCSKRKQFLNNVLSWRKKKNEQ